MYCPHFQVSLKWCYITFNHWAASYRRRTEAAAVLQWNLKTWHVLTIRYIFSIPYTAIQTAVSQRRLFHLTYADIDGHEASLQIKLESSQAASGVYRAITEKHAFYSCETVRSAVTAQFIRDLKVNLFVVSSLKAFHIYTSYSSVAMRFCNEAYAWFSYPCVTFLAYFLP